MSLNGISLKYLSETLSNIGSLSELNASALLKGDSFFAEVDEEILASVAGSICLASFSPGEIICRHGKFDEKFYLILKGSLRAVIPTEDDPRYLLYRLGKGDFFGEEVVFSNTPRENTIIAEDDVLTLAIYPDAIRKLMEKSVRIRSLLDQSYIDRKLRHDLRSVPLFSHLSDRLFEEVLNRVELLSESAGKTIFNEGDKGDSFYLIRDGEVNVYRINASSPQLIAILGTGQFFGEMALITGEMRNATVKTSSECSLVRISREAFMDILGKDKGMLTDLTGVVEQRRVHSESALRDPYKAMETRRLLDLNREVYRHLDIISQCTIDTERGSALLASLPGSRYPYVYPRDSACASRFLMALVKSQLKSGDIALRLLGEIARFICACQRDDGYWGQRYGISGEDKSIYLQEDNVAHGVTILCRYLLAAKNRGKTISGLETYLDAIGRGAEYARKEYYRNEIHLFYSTTSIHESAIEEGYSIWVNFSYLLMLRLIEQVGNEYEVIDRFIKETELKKSFESTLDNVFTLSGRYVRRLKPDGEVDLRPDITLLSPFFFSAALDQGNFTPCDVFKRSVQFIEETLWDPDFGMLQRYLPFIEDPDTHIHAGNGPWIQYTAMLAQYYFITGDLERGSRIMDIIDSYKSKEGYLCEHLTSPERFYEFKRLEWVSGRDYEKEFHPRILIEGIPYDNIVEELNHMKNAYSDVEAQAMNLGPDGCISFATPLMWSHAEYAMALILRTLEENRQYRLQPCNEK